MIGTTNQFGTKEKVDYREEIIRDLYSNETFGKVVLKGGYLMNHLSERSRKTDDIDFSISVEDGWSILKESVLYTINRLGFSSDIIVEYRDPEERMSAKIVAVFDEEFKEGTVSIDASWEPVEIGVMSSMIMDLSIFTYTIEHILVDKTCAIFTRKRFRRTKDLYDVWLLLSENEINYDELTKTFDGSRNKVDWESSPFKPEVIEGYKRPWESLKLESGGTGVIVKPELIDALSLYMEFITEYSVWRDSGCGKNYWEPKDRISKSQ